MSRDSKPEFERRHGVLARSIVMEGESLEHFSDLLASLQADFQPESGVELLLVESMAVARWRQLRIWAMEKSGIAFEMEKQEQESGNEETGSRDVPTRAAIAFRRLSDKSRALDLFHRYEARYSREYHRSLRALLDLRTRQIFAKRRHRDFDPYVD
jgi:hypothetical protein